MELLIFIIAVLLLFLFGYKIYSRIRFNKLYKIKVGETVNTFNSYEEEPLKIYIDTNQCLYVYQYRFWTGFIFGGTKTKTIVFTIVNGIIAYIGK